VQVNLVLESLGSGELFE